VESGEVTSGDDSKSYHLDLLLKNPRLLGHYAILGILAAIGLVVAHVQISTRMICSTSPAIFWFIAYCMMSKPPNTTRSNNSKDQEHVDEKYPSSVLPRNFVGRLVWYYALLFMLLGVILHPNFLPWT